MATYRQRLHDVVEERGALIVGLDPHPSILDAWGLPRTAQGLETCARRIVEHTGDLVAVYKPQSAFFETYGSAGIAALERVLVDIKDAGALSILDVKRGDIGSTMAAYADAYLADGAPLSADAITISPYLGFYSLQPAFDRAVANDRGVYVLARTSNPEGAQVQLALARDGEGSVVQEIVDAATELNRTLPTKAIGLVVGGTHRSIGADLSSFNGSLLVPGIGAQGGKIEDLADIFGDALSHVLPSVSRGVIGVGDDREALREQVRRFVLPTRSH